MKTILIVDGICPRGLAMVRYLSSTGEYHILIFTTDTTCAGAKAASALPSVTLLLNRATSGYDLQTFLAAAQRCPSVLICSNSTNSEGKEGVQWGARLVQTAASASVNHLVFLTMDQERKQYSTDNFIHSQSKSSMAWTIIRSPANEGSSSQSSNTESERSLTATQFRNLAYYVGWVFANPDRSTGLDFNLPTAEPSGIATSSDPKRRDLRPETSTTAGPSYQSASQIREVHQSTGANATGYMDAGRARAIQQWAAKSSTATKEESDDSGEDDEDEDDDDSGFESD